MEPIWGTIFFVGLCLISAVIAVKRGNSGILHFGITALLGVSVMLAVSRYYYGDQVSPESSAFIGVFLGILIAVVRRSDAQKAALNGSSKSHKKCQECAEVVKKDAVLCKHCGANLSPVTD